MNKNAEARNSCMRSNHSLSAECTIELVDIEKKIDQLKYRIGLE